MAIYPNSDMNNRFKECLEYAGPDDYDAEDLREIFFLYGTLRELELSR